MAFIKNAAVTVAAAGLLLSSTAYASETRADSVQPIAAVGPAKLTSAVKVKRKTASTPGYTNGGGFDATTYQAYFAALIAGLAGFALGNVASLG